MSCTTPLSNASVTITHFEDAFGKASNFDFIRGSLLFCPDPTFICAICPIRAVLPLLLPFNTAQCHSRSNHGSICRCLSSYWRGPHQQQLSVPRGPPPHSPHGCITCCPTRHPDARATPGVCCSSSQLCGGIQPLLAPTPRLDYFCAITCQISSEQLTN